MEASKESAATRSQRKSYPSAVLWQSALSPGFDVADELPDGNTLMAINQSFEENTHTLCRNFTMSPDRN